MTTGPITGTPFLSIPVLKPGLSTPPICVSTSPFLPSLNSKQLRPNVCLHTLPPLARCSLLPVPRPHPPLILHPLRLRPRPYLRHLPRCPVRSHIQFYLLVMLPLPARRLPVRFPYLLLRRPLRAMRQRGRALVKVGNVAIVLPNQPHPKDQN